MTNQPKIKPCVGAVEALEFACQKYLYGRDASKEVSNDSKIAASIIIENIYAKGYTITRAEPATSNDDTLASKHDTYTSNEPASQPRHKSDCALHNGPAEEPKPCDCGADPEMTPEKYGSEFPAPEPAAPSSDEVEEAFAYITPHPENNSFISFSSNKLRGCVNTLRAHIYKLEAQVKQQQWQPIETAPKDRIILLGLPIIGNIRADDRRVYEGRWDVYKNTWTSVNGFIVLSVASHWIELPCYPLPDLLAQKERTGDES